MKMETVDMTAKNIDKISALFPNCITEIIDEEKSTDDKKVYKKAVNFDILKQMLSGDVIEGDEAYEFTWVGKRASIVEANKPIRKTLRPCIEESLNWDNTENLYIEGDNLEVLKLLQESYLGKVKMIYIDPPYNTGNDFIYNDDFKMSRYEYSDELGEYDDDGNRLFKNTESNGRFHSDWCSMIYPRLMLARNLLSDDGVIFISIDDNEFSQLKMLCDEIFDENNNVANFCVIRAEGGGMAKQVIKGHDYCLVYAKDIFSFSPLAKEKDIRGKITERDKIKYWIQEDWLRKEFGKYGNCHYEEVLQYKGEKVKKEIDDGLQNGEYVLIPKSNGMNIVGKLRRLDQDSSKFYSILKHLNKNGVNELKELKVEFDYPKPSSLIKELVSGATFFLDRKEATVLDFFAGSGTTAHAVMQLNAEDGGNRKFIMVQLPEKTDEKTEAYKAGYANICEIGKERIRRAGKKILEENKDKEGIEKLDIGFRVLKVDDSNMNEVYYSPEKYTQILLSTMESNIKSDRNDLDLLFSCLLEWGLSLSLPYSSEQIETCMVHNYNDGDLIACFDENIPDTVIKTIAKKKPLRAVFRDSSFADSPSKINVGEIFKLLSPYTSIKVI